MRGEFKHKGLLRDKINAIESDVLSLDEVKRLYVCDGRKAVSEYVGLCYNSTGHFLKYFGLNVRGSDFQSMAIIDKKERVVKNLFAGDTKVKWYLVGYFLADGCLTTGKDGRVRICIDSKDLDFMQMFYSLFGDTRSISKHIKAEFVCYRVDLSTKAIEGGLRSLGFKERKSYVGWHGFDKIPLRYMHHFLRGLFDGDGGFTYTNGFRLLSAYYCGHPSYIVEVHNFLRGRFGIDVKLRYRHSDFCVFQFTEYEKLKRFSDYMYSESNGLRLNRKWERYYGFFYEGRKVIKY